MQFKKWIKKSLVILISLLTFGTITPAEFHWLDEANANKRQDNDSFAHSNRKAEIEAPKYSREQILQSFNGQAEMVSYKKFGDKIRPKIEKEFKEMILPKMEEAIGQLSMTLTDEELSQLEVTENPAGGSGERIFNITNNITGKPVIKFHVRREQPPLEGFWFNFHYHTAADQFMSHHDLGKIYWDKNTPPNWRASLH
ncbi:hypothetical protein JOC77_001982 [Peribacillus deserti]|uniref:Cell division protein FtsK n=1 Tax=Peribacillus deserti TaxID=673318 RepID=A0ABS2QHC7_9BACI|nr:YpjP family protein [Peribacillus deserti]MBM7692552.1 hypothetical protein [Peribacillus deserti]